MVHGTHEAKAVGLQVQGKPGIHSYSHSVSLCPSLICVCVCMRAYMCVCHSVLHKYA